MRVSVSAPVVLVLVLVELVLIQGPQVTAAARVRHRQQSLLRASSVSASTPASAATCKGDLQAMLGDAEGEASTIGIIGALTGATS